MGEAEAVGHGNNSGYIHPAPLSPGETTTIFHKPLLGICAQKCFVPCWALTVQGLVIELLLTGSATDTLLRTTDNAYAGDPSH